ncbi:MAG: hypothetical protein ABSE15_00275 [Candidatus Bathyarchaeia archaeon]|jgi:hypothetical protein
MKNKLTIREIGLAVSFAVLGFIFYTRTFLQMLNGLDAIEGLAVYYIVIWTSIFVLSRLDLVIFGVKIKSIQQTLGLLLITFSFFVVVDWSSPYVQWATTGHFTGASGIFYQDEDGFMWSVWSWIIPATSSAAIWVDRVLAFSVSPAILAIFGGILTSKKPRLG